MAKADWRYYRYEHFTNLCFTLLLVAYSKLGDFRRSYDSESSCWF